MKLDNCWFVAFEVLTAVMDDVLSYGVIVALMLGAVTHLLNVGP